MRISFRLSTNPRLSSETRITAWAVWSCIFVHLLCFLAVSYFEQINSLWWMTLGLAAGMQNNGWLKMGNDDIATHSIVAPVNRFRPNYLT